MHLSSTSNIRQEELPLLTLFGYDENNLAFDEDVCRSIENRRAQMSDVLIFDILLSLGGIKVPDSLYPPRDFSTLRRLLNAIETSTYDAMKKDGLIYFLLKWHTDGRDAKYQHSRGIPPQFVSLADAYWYLDSGENVAVSPIICRAQLLIHRRVLSARGILAF